jgi:hypothetical protein
LRRAAAAIAPRKPSRAMIAKFKVQWQWPGSSHGFWRWG